jgi:ABC-type antimicrobial peptide transport system permease subunit
LGGLVAVLLAQWSAGYTMEIIRSNEDFAPPYWINFDPDWRSWTFAFLASLFIAFAVFGLILGAVGQYALLAYNVSLRSREVGVRRALGAKDGAVLGLFLRQSLKYLLIGLSVGLVASLGFARLLSNILFKVEPFDLTTFVVVTAVLVTTAFLAAVLPARRALTVDPIVVLRYE